jgi:hypothetical protein
LNALIKKTMPREQANGNFCMQSLINTGGGSPKRASTCDINTDAWFPANGITGNSLRGSSREVDRCRTKHTHGGSNDQKPREEKARTQSKFQPTQPGSPSPRCLHRIDSSSARSAPSSPLAARPIHSLTPAAFPRLHPRPPNPCGLTCLLLVRGIKRRSWLVPGHLPPTPPHGGLHRRPHLEHSSVSPSSPSSYASPSSISLLLTPGSPPCNSIPSRFRRELGHADDGSKRPGHEEPPLHLR